MNNTRTTALERSVEHWRPTFALRPDTFPETHPDEDAALSQRRLHVDITKTYLYNFDPLKPHFYIVKLGFTEV